MKDWKEWHIDNLLYLLLISFFVLFPIAMFIWGDKLVACFMAGIFISKMDLDK